MRVGMRLLALVAVIGLAGCGLAIPRDPQGTLDRVQGGTLQVGATHHPPWIVVDGDLEPSGDEATLVVEFAAAHDAQVVWTIGNEESLVAALDRGELDVVVGGFTDGTPWSDRAATTVPYTEVEGADGRPEKHVMLVRMGENRLLTTLETFLLERSAR